MLRKMRLLLVDLHNATISKNRNDGTINNCENGIIEKKGDDAPSGKESNGTNGSDCRTCETYNPTTNHTISINAEETLYIIYLATMSEEQRYEFVMNFDSSNTTDVVRKQIIKEADMIASAIEVSDQLTSL